MHDQDVERARRGDAGVLEALLMHVSPPIRARIAEQISPRWRSLLSADDVMQQSWLDAFLRIADCAADTLAGFQAWLERIARNNMVDAIRRLEADMRGGHAQRVCLPEPGRSLSFCQTVLGIDSQTPSQAAQGAEAAEALHGALARLPAAYQAVVQRYDLEGWPIDRVAESVGRSPGAVHMLRARAHELLREMLARHFEKTRAGA